MGVCFNLALVAIFTTVVFAENHTPRNKRAIGIFNVVKFPNDACDSNSASMNGTCYTSEECSSKGGTASGECAEGYGVCCVLTVACAGSTSENGTYLSQASSTDPAKDSTTSRSCTYTICPITSTVSRIRLDLTEFSIAPPLAIADQSGAAAAATQAQANAVGYCNTDSFSVTGAPTICGTNKGQHLIVDSDGSTCITAAFSYGMSSTQSRAYTIQVTQFESTNEMGGPPGCLQFFTGDTGTVSSFNYNGVESTHMAAQNYEVCVRAGVDKCAICWGASTAGTAAIRGSFGVSASSADDAITGNSGAACITDFVSIPGGQAVAATIPPLAVGTERYCGRFLSTEAAATATSNVSVCSAVAPFKLGVNFDASEVLGAAGDMMAAASEASGIVTTSANPLGTMGFSLNFVQRSC